MREKTASFLFSLGQLIVLVLFVSCVPTPPEQPDSSIQQKASNMKELALRERVRAYLDLKAQGKWGNLAEYYDPEFRELAPRGNYARRVHIIDPQIDHIEFITPNSARVYVKFTIEIAGYQYPGELDLQTWIFKHDVWYYQPVNK